MRTAPLIFATAAVAFLGGVLVGYGPIGENRTELVATGGGVDSIRLTDPVTGAGLFTTNTDPNVTGVDPLTELDAPDGTDTGFGRMVEDRLADGLYNGGFRVGPPDPSAPMVGDTSDAGYNPLPYWSHVADDSGTWAMTWADGTVTMTHQADPSVESWIQQIMPISPENASEAGAIYTGFVVSGGVAASGVDPALKVYMAYLDADGVVTGSEVSDSDGFTTPFVVSVSLPAAPADAVYVRIRVAGVTSGAANSTGTITVLYAGIRRAFDVALYSDTTSTATDDRPGRIYQEDGDLILFPSAFADPFNPESAGAVVIGGAPSSPDVATGGLVLSAVVYDSLFADANNYAPPHGPPGIWETLYLTPSGASRTVTGIVAPARVGTQITIFNESSTQNLVLANSSGSSTAVNQILCPNVANLTIRPHGGVTLRYAPTAGGNARWWVVQP